MVAMKTLLQLAFFLSMAIGPVSLLLLQRPVTAPVGKKEPTLFLERMQGSENAKGLPKFKVELRNSGEDDLVLNVGVMLANGKKQYPNAISLVVTDSKEKSLELGLPGPFFVAGRVDPLVLPLPSGATFSLPVDLANCLPVSPSEPDYKFEGAYSIEARYTGKAVSSQEANLDTKGVALMPYWIGTVTSNRLPFDVAGK
jgi:hypothetical protein